MPKTTPRPRDGRVPLARALSKLGALSRSQAIEAVLAGRVTVRGVVVREPGRRVSPELDDLTVDGQSSRRRPRRILALHKPRGYVTTRVDPEGRPTVYALLPPDGDDLQAVGRLDRATTGLLLFTNDTQLAHRLTDPARGVPRTYVVTVRGALADATAQQLSTEGIEDGDDHLQADSIEVRKRSARETHVIAVLREGKNREIRRMFLAAGHEVTRLKRVAFGPVDLGDQAVGTVRDIDPTTFDGL